MIFEVVDGEFSYTTGKNILKDINIRFKQGEVITVLGPNGVGKTTLLKCMMGLFKWSKGVSYLNSIPISTINKRELFQQIAYVPQAKDMVYAFSAKDMVVFGRSAHVGTFRNPKKEDVLIAERTMKDIGIWYLRDKYCNQMSGGELQMVLIARALASEPEMLIMDEPESNLDFRNQLIVLDTISSLSKEYNIASLINTHYPEHALKISDKSLILGKKITPIYGVTRKVMTKDNLRLAFKTEVEIESVLVKDYSYDCIIPVAAI